MSDLWTGCSRFPDQISDSSQGADAQARELAAFVEACDQKAFPMRFDCHFVLATMTSVKQASMTNHDPSSRSSVLIEDANYPSRRYTRPTNHAKYRAKHQSSNTLLRKLEMITEDAT